MFEVGDVGEGRLGVGEDHVVGPDEGEVVGVGEELLRGFLPLEEHVGETGGAQVAQVRILSGGAAGIVGGVEAVLYGVHGHVCPHPEPVIYRPREQPDGHRVGIVDGGGVDGVAIAVVVVAVHTRGGLPELVAESVAVVVLRGQAHAEEYQCECNTSLSHNGGKDRNFLEECL